MDTGKDLNDKIGEGGLFESKFAMFICVSIC